MTYMKEMQDINGLYNEVREIITSARQNAVRSVDFCRVQIIGILVVAYRRRNKEVRNELTMEHTY